MPSTNLNSLLNATSGAKDSESAQQTAATGSGTTRSPHLLALTVVASFVLVALLVGLGVAVWWWTFRARGRRRMTLFRKRGDCESDSDVGTGVRRDGRVFGSYRDRENLREGGLGLGLGLGLGPVLDIRASSTGTGSVDLDKDGHENDPVPVIVISASGRDLSNFSSSMANDAQIPDQSVLDSITVNHQDQVTQVNTSLAITNEKEDEDEDASGSSFYSDEMLEELSSLAADLKRFSCARSLDVEPKSIDSVKSFAIMVVEVPDHEEQGLSAEPENVQNQVDVDVLDLDNDNDNITSRDSTEEAIESLEALLLSLERMANERVYDENQAYSDDSIYSDDSAYLSTISAPQAVHVPVPITEHVSVKPLKPLETIIEENSIELSTVGELEPMCVPGTPTTPGTSSDTTLRDEEMSVLPSSTPKKGTSSDTISALITALSSESPSDADPDYPVISPLSTLSLEPVAQHVLPGGTRAYLPFVNSVVTLRVRAGATAPESDFSRSALARLPLGEIKSNSAVANPSPSVASGVSQLEGAPTPSRPPCLGLGLGRGRGRVRTPSRENSPQKTKPEVGVPPPVLPPRQTVQQAPGRAMISSFR